jgi:hypothetical protein
MIRASNNPFSCTPAIFNPNVTVVPFQEIDVVSTNNQSSFSIPIGLAIKQVIVGYSSDLPNSEYIYDAITGELIITAIDLLPLELGTRIRVRSF